MSNSRAHESDDEKQGKAVRLTIPPRYVGLVGGGVTVGACLGMVRGARKASLQFLAENAHRPPRTVRGWYLYNKTKNYRVMLGAIRAGARQASRLGAVMLGWVGIEEGLVRVGCGEVKEIGAGAGTAGLFSLASGLTWRGAKRTVALGIGVGCGMRGLRWVQDLVQGRG